MSGLAKITIRETEGGSWTYAVSYGGKVEIRGRNRTTGKDGLRGAWSSIGLHMDHYARTRRIEMLRGSNDHLYRIADELVGAGYWEDADLILAGCPPTEAVELASTDEARAIIEGRP